MNSINAMSTSNLVPSPTIPSASPSMLTTPSAEVESLSITGTADQIDISPTRPPVCVRPVVQPTTWTPGMWWLLNRYEYLFVGLLPDQGEQITINCDDHDQSSLSSVLGQPHWGESTLINPPPAAATLPERGIDQLPEAPARVTPQPVGTFVDVVA